jgi:hypothetical protein
MVNVSSEELKKFAEELEKCSKKIGGGKIGMDATCVRELVRTHRDAGYRFVEIHCLMAQSQPGYLQPALIIATAYQVEFADETLVNQVMKLAEELNAWEHFKAIGYFKNWQDVGKVPRERTAAIDWWKSSTKTELRKKPLVKVKRISRRR